MDIGELFSLLAVVAFFVLSALAGGKKKKSQRGTSVHPTVPRQRPQARTRVSRPPTEAVRDSLTLAEQILEQIRGAQGPEEPQPVARTEAQSLETLEPAGERSHERFHEKYVAPELTPPAEIARPRPVTLTLNPKTVRQAVIWREVLGPPKGME